MYADYILEPSRMGGCSASGCKEAHTQVYHVKLFENWGYQTRWLCATHTFQALHDRNVLVQRELDILNARVTELQNDYANALGWLKAMHEGLVEQKSSEV